MKRVFLSLSAVALAVTFNACEGQDPENLPEKYNPTGKKEHSAHPAKHPEDAKHPTDAKADPHAKTPAHPAPAAEAKPAGEAKPH
jgi:hypothetical protein